LLSSFQKNATFPAHGLEMLSKSIEGAYTGGLPKASFLP
jgi:hypothetical protein